MTNPEFIQSAVTTIHQARELLDAGVRPNLLQTLTDLGHPYGLLLGQSSQSNPFESSVNLLFPEKKTEAIVDSKASNSLSDGGYLTDKTGSKSCTVISIPSGFVSGLSLVVEELIENAASSSNGPFSMSSLATSSAASGLISPDRTIDEYNNFQNRYEYPDNNLHNQNPEVPIILGLLFPTLLKGSAKLLASNNQDSARKIHMEELFTAQAVLAPGILKSLTELGERPRNLWVGRNQIGLGSSSIHLGTFKGEMPYVIKSPAGDQLAQINPGDTLGSVHVSSQANLLRNLSPLQKIEQITNDFIDLLRVVDGGELPNLNDKQRNTLSKAKFATIIGISHLVRLFGRKTRLPTWKLDVLPELVQKFHQHDSQAVSRAFGGSRKVKPSDVEMMVITPEMRRQLTATISL